MNGFSIRQLATLWAEDYRTHQSDWFRPGFRALATYRFGVWRMGVRPKLVRGLLSVLYKHFYRRSAYYYGIEIPYTARIGRRVTIEHQHGIVIHGASIVGDDCVLRHGVTLGIRSENHPTDAPHLGNRVSVGAGAKILGAVSIGDDAKIGANAVVVCDVPAGCTAAGVPAKILTHRIDRDSDPDKHQSFPNANEGTIDLSIDSHTAVIREVTT
ncbi:serine O-acetyltransferase [Planctomycetes bacterium K23_9]|uniref:Serine acetyltransferase n=1 Tax=Stieleria marina TaxID=1930275 RepID=A0A517NNT7_9BACT|nr:Serine acetyltransferase [Planctomycetes bacterium K23_9]